MDGRVLILVGALVGAAFLGSSGCTSPDPGSVVYAPREGSGGTGVSGGNGGGGGGGGDGGGGGGVPTDTVFKTAFAYTDPGRTANGASTQHQGTVVGKDCSQSTCHGTGGAGPNWSFAGTLYAAGGQTTIAKGEVKVVNADGTDFGSAYTDADGNFWYEGGALPAGSKVAVRADGITTIMHMATPLQPANSGCSSATANCHGTTAQGPVHVP